MESLVLLYKGENHLACCSFCLFKYLNKFRRVKKKDIKSSGPLFVSPSLPGCRPGQGKLLHFGQLANGVLPKLPGEGLEALALETFSRFWDKTGLCIGQKLPGSGARRSQLLCPGTDGWMVGWTWPHWMPLLAILGENCPLGQREQPLMEPCCCLVAQSCLTLATPGTVACQTPRSMGFSRQEYPAGAGLHCHPGTLEPL